MKMVDPKNNDARTPSAETVFPLSRVRTIMKSSQDTGQISNDVLFVMTRCSELFVQHLAKEAYNNIKGGDNSTLRYDHLSQLVNTQPDLEFLLQIIPEKITVSEFKEMVKDASESEDSEEDESDSE